MKTILQVIKRAAVLVVIIVAVGGLSLLVLHKLGEVKPPAASMAATTPARAGHDRLGRPVPRVTCTATATSSRAGAPCCGPSSRSLSRL